jgi:hypothetical protein
MEMMIPITADRIGLYITGTDSIMPGVIFFSTATTTGASSGSSGFTIAQIAIQSITFSPSSVRG